VNTLIPVIAHNGTGIVPDSGEGQNFFSAVAYTPVEYTVTAEDGSTVIWTVMVRLDPSYLNSINAIEEYLDDAEPGTAAAPIFLPVKLDLANTGGNGWSGLLSTIQSAGKNVALDLSACAISGNALGVMEFDPGTAGTGEEYIVSLVLPDTAASIKTGSYDNPTFKNFTNLKAISGAGVTTIGQRAFSDCTTLEMVSLPALTNTSGEVFYSCTALTTVSLPAAMSIGGYAFSYCTALETVSLPAATSIGGYAFRECTALTTVSLPASLTTMGWGLFSGCTSLSSITVASGNPAYKHSDDRKMLLSKDGKTLIAFPAVSGDLALDGITGIGEYAFSYCTALTTVNLPAAVSIGEYAFSYCTALTTVSLPAAASIDGVEAFGYCTALETLDLPEVTSVGRYAFTNCTGLTTVNLPAAINIDWGAFVVCTGLTTLTLPAAANIGGMAFYQCIALETVNLPAATSIGEGAFNGCRALTTLGLPAGPPTLGASVFNDTYYYYAGGALNIRVPAGKVGAYTTAWGVSVDTAANTSMETPTAYGVRHKQIVITDES
jgi:hypothetical protein